MKTASVVTLNGVGWSICYQSLCNSRASNHLISQHMLGNVTSFRPILVMDVWERAYVLDSKLVDRAKYIETFFSSINWHTLDKRLVV